MKNAALALAIVTGFGLTHVAAAQAQQSGQIPVWVWYVKRTTTQFTTGFTFTSTFGPYDTQAQAIQVRDQLNQQTTFGTSSSGQAYVIRGVNPRLRPGQDLTPQRRNVRPFRFQQQRTRQIQNGQQQMQHGTENQKGKPQQQHRTHRRIDFR